MSDNPNPSPKPNLQLLDSQRARHTPLVISDNLNDHHNDDLQQNIKIKSQTTVKSLSSHSQPHQQFSVLDPSAYNLQKAIHPSICISTFAFKISAFLTYIILGNFISSILTFILVLLFSSIDFWIVKNISGRLLVGLRWKSQYDLYQKQVWMFQTDDNDQKKPNKIDKLFFWSSQIVFTIVWSILSLLNILTLSFFWALLVLLNTGLCGVNLYAYYLCKEHQDKQIKKLKKKMGKKVIQQVVQRGL